MTGLPVVPVAQYSTNSRVIFLPAQAAGDPAIMAKVRNHLGSGATVVVTPAFLRKWGLKQANSQVSRLPPHPNRKPQRVFTSGQKHSTWRFHSKLIWGFG